MPTDLVTIAITAALTQFIGPGANHLGEQALERAKQVASKAAGLLDAVGREPQPVEPKLLLPLVQAASLETDPTLAEKWAALLANAADPVQRVAVQVGFAEILRQLTPIDAQVLEFIYAEHPPQGEDLFCHYPTVEDALSNFDWQALTTETSLGNLSRLRLFDFASGSLYTADNDINAKQRFIFTAFGGQFMQAIISPTP